MKLFAIATIAAVLVVGYVVGSALATGLAAGFGL